MTYTLLVLTYPTTPEGGTKARVGLVAGGRDLSSGNIKDPVVCASTGRLERRLMDAVTTALGVPAAKDKW